jgi:[acyl-carrier-protein] S-malonyltransferase
VERGMAAAKAKGAKIARMLPMSAPSHCSLMKPAAERLREALASVALHVPKVPVVQNAHVEAFGDADRIRQALVEQLYRPVRWVETVRYLADHGVTRIVECAPGKVLAGLAKRIADEVEGVAVTDSAALSATIA